MIQTKKFFLKIINSANEHKSLLVFNFNVIKVLLNCLNFALIINKILKFKFGIL